MKKTHIVATLGLLLALTAGPSMAAITSVSGGASTAGAFASIIAAPSDVGDDAAWNTAQQGFNEKQGVLLGSSIAVAGGSIAAGQVVDSHMIFLNSGPGNSSTRITHNEVDWTFSGAILGVMVNTSGSQEAATSSLLGAAGTSYPGAFPNRGLEGGDGYSIAGNVLTLSMVVTEPGDWIRVVTASPVPAPSAVILALTGLAGLRRARRFVA